MYVFGPETHMTAIVGMALGKRLIPSQPTIQKPAHVRNQHCLTLSIITFQAFALSTPVSSSNTLTELAAEKLSESVLVNLWIEDQERQYLSPQPLFTAETKAIVWGMQPRAIQGMLDFDHLCSRKEPSVSAMVYPFR